MSGLRDAISRAYRSGWTGGLIAFELVGALLVGLHSRTTVLWPFLAWLGCAPLVRFLYLHKLHRGGPLIWGRAARRAYAITGWLLLAGAGLGAATVGLLGLVRHLPLELAILARHTGYVGVACATFALAAAMVVAVSALCLWGGLTTVAYAKAVVEPADHARKAVARGLMCVWREAPLVIGVSALQGLFVAYAIGAQLFKPSGITVMPMVWPAALFAPVALVFVLALTESFSGRRSMSDLVPQGPA
ncbi:MAG: hypothetical protein ACYCTF_04675 [Acidiferrobacter sp.]